MEYNHTETFCRYRVVIDMINGKKVLAFVPARGGSKGIKGKNIYPIDGLPLICYTLRAGRESKYIDMILVSTDDDNIADAAKKENAAVIRRPEELSSDTSKTIDAVIHALKLYPDYQIFVLLQPTSPLRTSKNIDEAIELFEKKNEESLCSVSPVSDSPLLIRTIDENSNLIKLLDTDSTVRRQDMKPYYRVNGAIYIKLVSQITSSTSFNDSEIGYIMPKDSSVDIDELSDILYAECLLKLQQGGTKCRKQ